MDNCYKLYKICEECSGVGSIIPKSGIPAPYSQDAEPCKKCRGKRYVLWGYMYPSDDVPKEPMPL